MDGRDRVAAETQLGDCFLVREEMMAAAPDMGWGQTHGVWCHELWLWPHLPEASLVWFEEGEGCCQPFVERKCLSVTQGTLSPKEALSFPFMVARPNLLPPQALTHPHPSPSC